MTPELIQKFQNTIETGKVVLYPGVGADIRKRFAGVACIVRLRYADIGGTVFHAIDSYTLEDLALERIVRGDPLEVAAWDRLNEA